MEMILRPLFLVTRQDHYFYSLTLQFVRQLTLLLVQLGRVQFGSLQAGVDVHVRGQARVPAVLVPRRQRAEVGQVVLSVREGGTVPSEQHAGRRGLEMVLLLSRRRAGQLSVGPVLELQRPGLMPLLLLLLLLLQLQDILDGEWRGGERTLQHHVIQLLRCSTEEMMPTE